MAINIMIITTWPPYSSTPPQSSSARSSASFEIRRETASKGASWNLLVLLLGGGGATPLAESFRDWGVWTLPLLAQQESERILGMIPEVYILHYSYLLENAIINRFYNKKHFRKKISWDKFGHRSISTENAYITKLCKKDILSETAYCRFWYNWCSCESITF